MLFYVLTTFTFASFIGNAQNVKEVADEYLKANKLHDKALKLRYKNPDSTILLLKESYEIYKSTGDYKKAIGSLTELSIVHESNADYAYSYNALWNALMVSDEINDDDLKTLIYLRLGRIYSYYKREKESLTYLKKALKIQKKLVKKKLVESSNLTVYYYALTSTSRELGNYKAGEKYLDSSYLYYSQAKSVIHSAYLDFERGYFASKRNEHERALEIFNNIEPWFMENEPSYLVLIYKYIGDVYFELSDLGKSEQYYLNALQISNEYKSHLDFTPLAHEALSRLYLIKGNYKDAFFYQKKAKDLNTKFFDSRSKKNQSLFKIKNNFRLEKERQEKIIQAQQLKELEQEEKIYNLKISLLFICIISVILIGFTYLRNLRIKHKDEKTLIRKNKALEISKSQELLDLKNKELAVSALQLIEKDEFLKTLKTKMRESGDGIKTYEINKVLRSVTISNNQRWEEFKLRFIEVNESFYDEVSNKFPHLSQNDLKICALIKLNFSSKEMARLLGISPESVHTKRYRLRKKMGIIQGTNLEDYIASL